MSSNSITTSAPVSDRANQRNALAAGFLGWTLDAFDFFVLTFVLVPVARDLHVSVVQIAATITASLAMRPVGAFFFGLMADRYGRRWPLMLDIVFYSVIEVLSGLAPNYQAFFVLRLLYGIGMGGNWGVGASLAMESVSPKWRGILSGLLQEGYAFGNLLAALVYALVFPHWGWRMMFFVGGLPALLSLFIFAKVKESEAWHESRTDWSAYGHAIARHWKLFLYMVLLMTTMNSHFAWDAGSVPHVVATTAPLQSADHGDDHDDLHGGSDCRRTAFRTLFRPSRTTPRHGDRSGVRIPAGPRVGHVFNRSAHSARGVSDAVHGARRVGRDSRPSE